MARNWVAVFGLFLVGCPAGGSQQGESTGLVGGMYQEGGNLAPAAYNANVGTGGHPNSCPDT